MQEMIHSDISGTYKQIREVLIQARSCALQAVNTKMVACYWQIGRLIGRVERIGYGKRLIMELSKRDLQRCLKAFPELDTAFNN